MTDNNGLPLGWEITELINLGDFLTGITYKKADGSKAPKEGYLPVLRANNISDSKLNFDDLVYVPVQKIKDEQIVQKHDIVICMSSGSKRLVGKAAQVEMDFEVGFGAFCGLFRCSPSIEPKFVGYFFQSPKYRNTVSKVSKGVNINNLRRAHIESLEIPVPPAPEQERIVAKIEELFTQLEAGVAELEQAKAQLQRYRQAVLKSAVEGELTREWREVRKGDRAGRPDESAENLLARILSERRAKWEEGQETGDGRRKKKYKEPAPPDTDGLPELPQGWVWANFDQLLLKLKNGFFGGRPATEPPGVPLLRISAVRPMSVSYDSLRYIREISEEKLNNYQIEWGDLLLTRYNGNPNLVGACGMVRKVSEPTLYPDKLIRALVPKHLVKPDYLEIYFSTSLARSFCEVL